MVTSGYLSKGAFTRPVDGLRLRESVKEGKTEGKVTCEWRDGVWKTV